MSGLSRYAVLQTNELLAADERNASCRGEIGHLDEAEQGKSASCKGRDRPSRRDGAGKPDCTARRWLVAAASFLGARTLNRILIGAVKAFFPGFGARDKVASLGWDGRECGF